MLGGLLALFSMMFLGFADDVLDIRWRVKLWLPYVASVPLLIVYYVTYDITDVVVPLPLRPLLGQTIIHLGPLYYVYIGTLCAFATNSINILAGVNGIEGAQSVVIALSLAINNFVQMEVSVYRYDANLFSLFFLLPYLGCSLGYLNRNWFPARVFGGDTFAYFSGMVFAVVGILNNMSKTVVLFMVPQLFNFALSCPQLFRFVECPRHRMPRLNKKTGMVEYTKFSLKEAGRLGKAMVLILEVFGLAKVTRVKGEMHECSNLTLINVVLWRLGPMREDKVTAWIMAVQVLFSCIGFGIRYGLVHIVYN